MGTYTEINGDLIQLALEGTFDVIAHGVNCFCTQKSGLAPQMVRAFGTDHANFYLEEKKFKGDINKLGNIEVKNYFIQPDGTYYCDNADWEKSPPDLQVVNAYTQYHYGKNHSDGVENPLDYEALTLCMRKINNIFKGKHIGLPFVIGCGLAGGNKEIVLDIIKKELKDCKVTMVKYNG